MSILDEQEARRIVERWAQRHQAEGRARTSAVIVEAIRGACASHDPQALREALDCVGLCTGDGLDEVRVVLEITQRELL